MDDSKPLNCGLLGDLPALLARMDELRKLESEIVATSEYEFWTRGLPTHKIPQALYPESLTVH
jgi:hypothetical protein